MSSKTDAVILALPWLATKEILAFPNLREWVQYPEGYPIIARLRENLKTVAEFGSDDLVVWFTRQQLHRHEPGRLLTNNTPLPKMQDLQDQAWASILVAQGRIGPLETLTRTLRLDQFKQEWGGSIRTLALHNMAQAAVSPFLRWAARLRLPVVPHVDLHLALRADPDTVWEVREWLFGLETTRYWSSLAEPCDCYEAGRGPRRSCVWTPLIKLWRHASVQFWRWWLPQLVGVAGKRQAHWVTEHLVLGVGACGDWDKMTLFLDYSFFRHAPDPETWFTQMEQTINPREASLWELAVLNGPDMTVARRWFDQADRQRLGFVRYWVGVFTASRKHWLGFSRPRLGTKSWIQWNAQNLQFVLDRGYLLDELPLFLIRFHLVQDDDVAGMTLLLQRYADEGLDVVHADLVNLEIQEASFEMLRCLGRSVPYEVYRDKRIPVALLNHLSVAKLEWLWNRGQVWDTSTQLTTFRRRRFAHLSADLQYTWVDDPLTILQWVDRMQSRESTRNTVYDPLYHLAAGHWLSPNCYCELDDCHLPLVQWMQSKGVPVTAGIIRDWWQAGNLELLRWARTACPEQVAPLLAKPPTVFSLQVPALNQWWQKYNTVGNDPDNH